MIICPECCHPIGRLEPSAPPRCGGCDFPFVFQQGIWDGLSRSMRADPVWRNYSENYNAIAEDDLKSAIMEEPYAEIQADKMWSYIGELSGVDACDLGVGRGRLLSRLINSSARGVTGVDIASSYLEKFSNSRARLVFADAEDLPFQDEFDLIVCSDILEHVLSLSDALLSIHRALRPRGRLVVRVPYREDLTQYARKNGCPYRFVHLRAFDRRILCDALESTGFNVSGIHFDGYDRDRYRPLFRTWPARPLRLLASRSTRNKQGISAISNRLGRLMMRPIEIVADAIKV